MRGWLGLGLGSIALAAACGGASQSDLFADGTSSGTTSSSSSSGDPGGGTSGTSTTPTATGTTTSPVPTGQPCATQTFYRDRDGDGVGGTETKVACTSPGKEWVTKGGDCNDDDADVFPGQTAYFDSPYNPKGGAPSYDYDCSKKEEQEPPTKKAAATCTLAAGGCQGSGYVPSNRATGSGVDNLCGATKFQTCKLAVGGPPGCEAQVTTAEKPISCH